MVLSWIENIEDGLVDCAVGARLRSSIGGEVAGDAQFGSPSRREMDDNQGDQEYYFPADDNKGEIAATHGAPSRGCRVVMP